PDAAVPRTAGGGKLVPAKAVGAVSRAAGEATPRDRRDSHHAGRVGRLAAVAGDRQAGHADSLASKGVSVVLAWRSKGPGRPRIPANLRRLIAQMSTANRTWGEERIAAELRVKLGIQVSPRTVQRYMAPRTTPRSRTGSQAWSTLVRNHARAVLACDFFVSV